MLQLNLIQKNDYVIIKIEGDNFSLKETTEAINQILPEVMSKGVILDGRAPGQMIGKFGAMLANKCQWVGSFHVPSGKVAIFAAVGRPELLDREIPYNSETGELDLPKE